MTRKKLKLDQLAKLRQFRQGDDVGDFLSTQFRQVIRALEHGYVDESQNGKAETQSCGSISTTSITAIDAANLRVNFKANGGRIWVGLVGVGDSFIGADNINFNCLSIFKILRDSTEIASHTLSAQAGGANSALIRVPSSCLYVIEHDLPPGDYVYKVQYLAAFGTARIQNAKLVVYEF